MRGINNIDFTISGILACEKIYNRIISTSECRNCKAYKLIFMDIEMPGLNGY